MSQLGLPTAGGADGVTVLKQGFNVDPILQKQADCISTMTYNEYYQIIEAGRNATSSWQRLACWKTSWRIQPLSPPWRSS